MGLSSSQGRLLMLTSRLSDIELGEVMISQRQNTLAWESEKAATEYNEAISNYKLQIKVTDPSEDKGYRKEDVTYNNMTSMGYLVTNANMEIYLQKDENGEWIIPTDLDGKPLLTINSDGKATIGDDTETTYDILDGGTYLSNKNVLQDAIINGLLFVMDTSDLKTGISLTMLQSETDMEYTLKIRTTTNLPLEYKLYMNQSADNANSDDIIEIPIITQDEDATYFKQLVEDKKEFPYTQGYTNTYTLVIEFPEEFKGIEYQDIIECIEISIDSKQIID